MLNVGKEIGCFGAACAHSFQLLGVSTVEGLGVLVLVLAFPAFPCEVYAD